MVDQGVSVLLLAFNEVTTIRDDISGWRRLLRDFNQVQVVVAEDGSSDGSSELLAELNDLGEIVHCSSPVRRGYRGALSEGLACCEFQSVILADAGGKIRFDSLGAFVADLDFGGVVAGNRASRTDSRFRQMLSGTYSRALSAALKVPVPDADCGLRKYDRDSLREALDAIPDLDLINSKLLAYFALRDVPIRFVEIAYTGREGASRGLPWNKIPAVIFVSLRFLREVRLLRRSRDAARI